MVKKMEVLTLKTSSLTGNSWFIDEQGKRCSEIFKVTCRQQSGALTLLITDKGTILYSKYSREYNKISPNCGWWSELIQLSEKVYLAACRGRLFSSKYYLFDENLKPVLSGPEPFTAVQTLTANLMGVQNEKGWGIIDMVTGELVQ